MTDKITNEDLAQILAQEDPRFRAFVERFDPKCWARYDLSALRIGWHFARQEAEQQMIERCEELVEGYAKNNTDLREAIRALGAANDT